jgi:glutamyl-tRNA reductase
MGQVRSGLAFASESVRQAGAIAVAAARDLRRACKLDADVGGLLDQGLAATGTCAGGTILVLGTGHQARATARRAAALGFDEVVVAGRTEPNTLWLGHTRFRFLYLNELPAERRPEVLVGCLGEAAGEYAPGVDAPRPSSAAIDLGTPRNLVDVPGLRCVTIAELLAPEHDPSRDERAALRAQLRALVERRLEMASADSRSAVGALRQSVEQARREQLPRIGRLHPEVPAETIDAITRALVNQLFHHPSERLKRLDDADLQEQMVALFAAPRGEGSE